MTPFACAAPLRGKPPPASYHFVDFRARSGGVFGHTYVVYGTIDNRGHILSARAAGFYPSGALSDSVLSAVLPMPGYVGLEPSDGNHPPSAIYRYYLNADSYERLVTVVASLREARPAWDLLLFNCNAFTAKVARSIGLRAPSSLKLPNNFIHGLYLMNGPREAKVARGRRDSKS
jgi:hypothetical protein